MDNIEIMAAPSELIPPQITMIPPVVMDTINSSSPQTIAAKITDNSGIDTAFVVYYTNGTLTDTLGMTEFGTDSFHVDIPFVGYGRTVTYFVEASDQSAAGNTSSTSNYNYFLEYKPVKTIQIGNGTATASHPFYSLYEDARTQMLITASELSAQGAVAGQIDQIAFDVASFNSQTLNGLNIEMKQSSLSSLSGLSSFVNAGWTNVYAGTYTFSNTGWTTFQFQNSFTWDGTSNILINVCFDNNSWSGNTSVYATSAAGMTYHEHTDNDAGCSLTTGNVQSNRPNVRFRINIPSTLNNDAGVAQLTNPTGGVTANSNFDVKTRIKNFGVDSLTSADISWELNGVAQTTFNYTDTLAPDSMSDELTLGTINVSQGSHHLKIWTDNPNGTFDDNTTNDTLKYTFYGCANMLSGTYTIGGANPDYATFSEAVLALEQCGINGAVTFNVSSGNYNEQISIPPVSGSSASNTITFQSVSGDSTDVTLAYNASAVSENYVVELAGASNMEFKGMTFENQDSLFARAISLKDSAHSISFYNNRFIALDIPDADSNRALIASKGAVGDNFTLENNRLVYGSYGLNLYGQNFSNVNVKNNTFYRQYAGAIVLKKSNAPLIKNNSISTNSGYDGFGGINLIQSYGAFELSYNQINISNTASSQGIRISESAGDSLNHAGIYNNMIRAHGTNASLNVSSGIYNEQSKHVDYLFNSVNVTGNTTNSAAMRNSRQGSFAQFGVVVKNNIFANFSGGVAVIAENTDTIHITNDYNDLWATGDLADLNSTAIGTLNDWEMATGQGGHSVSTDPYFTSNTDLHTNNNKLNATGIPISGIADDIDGNTRDASTPDMGADEFTPSPYDLELVEILTPNSGCGLTANENITLRVKNIGSAAINSFSAGYQLNGGSIVSETVSSSLNPGDTLDFTFSSTVDLDVSTLQKDSLYSFLGFVNYTSDPVQQNDSMYTSINSRYQPPAPTATAYSVAYEDSLIITAQSNDSLLWYESDTATNYLKVGQQFQTPALYDTTQYWVEARSVSYSPLVITEYSANPDAIEVQNISASAFDATGWQVIASDDNSNINIAEAQTWTLGQFQASQVMRGDENADFGSVGWTSSWNIWVMLVDTMGNIRDFVARGWSASDIQSMSISAGGYTALNPVTQGQWSGDGAATGQDYSLRNVIDNDDASDWTNANAGSLGQANANMSYSYLNACASPRIPVTINVTGIPADNAGISAIKTNTGCDLDMEPVTIDIFNAASVGINGGLTATYKVDNNAYISPEQVNVNIPPKDTISYTFSTPANLDAPVADTNYSIKAYVTLVNDTFNSNDTMMLSNIQSLYTPPAVSVNDTTIDYGKKVTKTINSNTTVFWYTNDTIQAPLFKGNTYTTPVLYDTTTYYLENVVYGSLNQSIGAGTQSQNEAPANGYYNYNWANMLYLSSEIGSDAQIDTLKFYVDNSVSGFTMPNQKVFIAHQSAASLSTTKPDPATMTKVYEGSVTWNGPGWVAIPLSSSFDYNGLDNLQIYWENRDGSWDSGYPNFAATSTGTTLCVENHLDASFPTTSGTSNDRPNIQLVGQNKGCNSARVPWTVNVLGQPDYDAAIVDIPDPNTGTELTAAEPVTVSIWNSGGLAISNFDVNYRIDSGSVVTETVSASINSGDTLDYTFNQMADLQSYKTYDITAWSSLSGDTTNANDTAYKQVTNNPLVYCNSSATSTMDSEIDEVIINTLSNNTAGICADYSDFTHLSTSVSKGASYQLSVTLGTCGNDYDKSGAVFFDWNKDGDFDDSNEAGPSFGPTNPTQTYTNTITVPANASTGNIRMRIVAEETTTPSSITACGTYTYGETEDYTLVVIPSIPNDAGITEVVAPQFSGNEGDVDTLEAVLKNFGTDTLFSTDILYEINGGSPVSYSYNDTLLSQNTDTVQLPNFIRPADTSTICVYTSMPGDSNTINDQTCYDIYGSPAFDANLVAVHPLASGCGLSQDTIFADIANGGGDTLMPGFTVKYMINSQTSSIVSETVNDSIFPGDTITYEFSNLIDLSVTTFDSIFDVKVWAEVSSDNNPKNDTAFTSTTSKHIPGTPLVNDTTINFGTQASLIAQATAPVYWYDSLNSVQPIYVGDTLTTPVLTDSAVYYFGSSERNKRKPSDDHGV